MYKAIQFAADDGRLIGVIPFLAEEEHCSGPASSLLDGEIGGIDMGLKGHVAYFVPDLSVWMGSGVVKEPVDCLAGVAGGLRLFASDVAKHYKHKGVNSEGIIEQTSEFFWTTVFCLGSSAGESSSAGEYWIFVP